MGLTAHYDWNTKADVVSARRTIVKFRAMAIKLPFDKVSEIYEQDLPDRETSFALYDESFRQGDLYLSRRRGDGEEEVVHVPALHAVFFTCTSKVPKAPRLAWQVIHQWFCTGRISSNGVAMARSAVG